MIFTFDNKFDQTDEADYMLIFQIKHQYSFWIIAHILFNALLRVLNRFSWPRLTHLCDLDPDIILNDIIITFLV
jgi:hypothetical protein